MKSSLQKEDRRNALRLLKVLSKYLNAGITYKSENQAVLLKLGEKQYRFSLNLISLMRQQKLITIVATKLTITTNGVLYLKQSLNPDALLAPTKNQLKSVGVVVNNQSQQAQLNTCESPLMRLFTRKTKSGTTYISMEEFQAGERLRADFERGQLQPKISASLQGSIGSSGRSGFSDVSDIADFALDARGRVGKAIENLGPELSGVTLDICCFLKGLECVERERRWPPRSAKLMLKTALSLLAKHYGISGYENRQARKNHFWGSSDFRPTINT